MKRAATRPLAVPAFGLVRGGRLDGWRFHFVGFRLEGRALEIIARCTPPNWPFFREIWMDHTHFMVLRRVVGERAPQRPALPLITTTYQAAGVEPPDWLGTVDTTLRALIKRTHTTRRRTGNA